MDGLLEHDEDILRPPWGSFGRAATLGVVSGAAKLLLQVFNTTVVINHETFTDLVTNRPPGVGLITYCNHTSTFDDPGLPSALLPWHFFWTEFRHQRNRWTMCAHDICHTTTFLTRFFLSGKTLPIERGAGVEQPSMRAAAARLAPPWSDWLHLFPEGRVSACGSLGPLRQGIGRLVCDARRAAGGRDPIVLPFLHSGMARVMPYRSSVPRIGHTVHVVVGQPLQLDHITCRCDAPGEEPEEVWRDIAAAMHDALQRLEAQLPPNPDQLAENPGLEEVAYPRRRRQLAWSRTNGQGTGGGTAIAPGLACASLPGSSTEVISHAESVGTAPGTDESAAQRAQVVASVVEDGGADAWPLEQQLLGSLLWRLRTQTQEELTHVQAAAAPAHAPEAGMRLAAAAQPPSPPPPPPPQAQPVEGEQAEAARTPRWPARKCHRPAAGMVPV